MLLGRGTDNADVVVVDSATGKTIKVIRNADLPGCHGNGYYLSDTVAALDCSVGGGDIISLLQL